MEKYILDVNLLKSKIYDEKDKDLFDEIIICIENGAFRSAGIIIWISIAESLKTKLNILANGNREIKKDMSNYNKKKQDFLLINYAKKYKFINGTEYHQLNAIISDRNNYSHPNYEVPTKDKLISYLYFAVEYVLSRPPYYTYKYAENFLDQYLTVKPYYYVDKSENQIKNYANSFVQRLDKNTLNSILICFFDRIEKLYVEFDENKVACIQNCLVYLNELMCLDEFNFSDEEYTKFIDDYPNTAFNIFTFENNWDKLDSSTKTRIFYESIEEDVFSEVEFVSVFYQLYKSDLLTQELKSIFEEKFDEFSLDSLIFADLDYNIYFNKIISYFNEFKFEYQISAINALKYLDLSKFNDNQLYEIGYNMSKKAFERSWACQEVIYDIYSKKSDKFLKTPILQGIVDNALESPYHVYESNGIFVKHIFHIVLEFDEEHTMINDALEKFESNLPSEEDIGHYFETIENFDELKEEDISYEVNLVIKSIKKMACKSVNKLFDSNIRQLLDNFNFREIANNIHDCLNESKRKEFSKLAFECTINFIEFFSDYKTTVIDGRTSNELFIKWDLMDQFIKYDDLQKHVEGINSDELSKRDLEFIEVFLNR